MSTTAEKTQTTDAASRLADLRARAEADVEGAAREAWGWIEELGELAKADRVAGEAKLNELFALGRAPKGIDGATEGILVAPLIQPLVDKVAGAFTSAWMPWQGKSFDAAASTGTNRLTGETRWVAKLLWPLYRTRSGQDGERLAFDFETRVEPGMHDPDTEVLVIDYAPVDSNPRLIIKAIRDELVEVVPGANLGKILYRRGGGYTNIGFFALRS